MARVEMKIHPSNPLGQDTAEGHNRWHPDIGPIARCRHGDTLVIETRDALDGQVTPETTLADLETIDSNLVHPMTGPVHIEGAEPGDILEVEIVDIAPATFGYTVQSTGFGFLRDVFPDRYLVKWRLEGGFATSEQLPGIRIPADPFMGTIGVAPDRALLERANAREAASLARGEFGFPPTEPQGAVPARLGAEALRTGPPRENGGNIDIRQTGIGARLFFPVFVEGALFSTGDAHFAQGDGEVCGQGIEMRATLTARLTLHKQQAARDRLTQLRFIHTETARATSRQYMATTGLSLDDNGTNVSESINLAARRALLGMIDYLGTRGYHSQQAYAICSATVDLRISELVDVPNAIVSAFLPLDIFT
ncbi:acetamidase/formamidase family protein [Mesorhizobium sp. ORM16]|uniref:acetamidase/formamidase family protein n=1 Tax=Mesorhizobium sp. ORM16 TaxID=3376989 RepID=UPI0038577A0C